MVNALPEEDVEYLQNKGVKYELVAEKDPNGNERRGVLFPDFEVPGNLGTRKDGTFVSCEHCELLIIIPQGYATTRLDSFYTIPHLKRKDGSEPDRANSETKLFGRSWQFWSRHLDEKDWRVGIDGLSTYCSYIAGELRNA